MTTVPFIQRRDSGEFTFVVNSQQYKITADSPKAAMTEMNRTVMAKLQGPFAWMDHPGQLNTWYAASGNFFD
jgi:hypothetical protein